VKGEQDAERMAAISTGAARLGLVGQVQLARFPPGYRAATNQTMQHTAACAHLALQQQEQQVLGVAEGAAQRAARTNVHLPRGGTSKLASGRQLVLKGGSHVLAMRGASPTDNTPVKLARTRAP